MILVGSQALKLSSPRDTDYLIFENREGQRKSWFEENNNFHSIDAKDFKKIMNFDKDMRIWNKLYNYVIDRDINPNELDYNVFNYKDEIRDSLKWLVTNHSIVFKPYINLNNNGTWRKTNYHILYNLYLLLNDSKELTEEQKAVIQKIHDKEMPATFGEEVEKMILDL